LFNHGSATNWLTFKTTIVFGFTAAISSTTWFCSPGVRSTASRVSSETHRGMGLFRGGDCILVVALPLLWGDSVKAPLLQVVR
jgi:hypothetical protein